MYKATVADESFQGIHTDGGFTLTDTIAATLQNAGDQLYSRARDLRDEADQLLRDAEKLECLARAVQFSIPIEELDTLARVLKGYI